MKKRVLSCILAGIVFMSGCGSTVNNNDSDNTVTSEKVEESVTTDSSKEESPKEETENKETENKETTVTESSKTLLLGDSETIYYDQNLVPSIPAYSVKDDFSNVVINKNQEWTFNTEYQSDYNDAEGLRKALIKNNFAVVKGFESEFFDIYEGNRYSQIPSFITVDSLMHTYHLYFAYLMKQSEKNYLANELKTLSKDMLSSTSKQYEALKGTEYEKAALRNLAFFYIGNALLDEGTQLPVNDEEFKSAVESELSKINAAGGVEECQLTSLMEDYTQYKPRGYYEGDEELEKYFRAMMWYGRLAFALDNEDMVRSAVLQTLAIADVKDKWEGIYSITSFFAGASDDPGYEELSKIVDECYSKTPDVSEVAGNNEAFNKVFDAVQKIKVSEINSVPVEDGENPVIPSYRFMGQRFTIDAAIMQRLVYSAVEENSAGQRRMLPDTLDTPAALGSEKATEILKENGAFDYKNYSDNMTLVKERFNNSDASLWNASLYAGWLNTLRPLLEKKGEGYPSYMNNEEWEKKNLETFAGSYAELKHDTILYAKQVMAEMGDGDEEVLDDRGYVDTQPVVYSRFKFLSEKTKEGLEKYGMLSDSAKEDLDKLSEIAGTLLAISEKELKNESLSEEDYEFIRCYGGYIEHFWREANKDSFDGDLAYSYQAPCPVIADIATDPNGTVLEVGSGQADIVYVVYPIDGELHVGRGSAYSFYQFEQPIDQRLTDSQWRSMLEGGYLDDNWNWVETDGAPDQPEWTKSYRIGK